MSAVRSNGNRELEELDRAQRAHEPSMQEILDSLVALIADDKANVLSAAPHRIAPRRPAAAASGPVVYSKDAPVPQHKDVLAFWSQPAPANSAAAPEASRAKQREEGYMLPPAAEAAVASAFDTLFADLAARRAEVSDETMRELLRPLLKAWVDENLPKIVKPLVRGELERAARGPRGGVLR
jgi:cell pole-organizing protein PopZ